MYFQLEVGYYSNANINKNKNFQLKASIKNNLKIVEDEIVQGTVFATRTCHTLLLGLAIFFKCKLCFFEQGISRSIFISIRYK